MRLDQVGQALDVTFAARMVIHLPRLAQARPGEQRGAGGRRLEQTERVNLLRQPSISKELRTVRRRWLTPNVINLSCSPAQGKPPEAASRHGRRAMTRPLPLNQAV